MNSERTMFDFLNKYQIILVTGPQRSGTTICARMIAADLNIRYLDEGLWDVWNGQQAREIAESQWPCVLQGPGLLKDIGLFNQPKCAVVYMIRDLDEIRASQERINWNMWAEKELSYYITGSNKEWYERYVQPMSYWAPHDPLPLGPAKDEVAYIKGEFWIHHSDKLLTYKNWYDVAYKLLHTHPMWLPKEKRTDFSSRQFREKK